MKTELLIKKYLTPSFILFDFTVIVCVEKVINIKFQVHNTHMNIVMKGQHYYDMRCQQFYCSITEFKGHHKICFKSNLTDCKLCI